MNIEKQLKEAIEAGEVLRISYAGGSQPGTARDIAPISVKGGKVRARCYSSNAVKLFALDKISILDQSSAKPDKWEPDRPPRTRYSCVGDIVAEHAEEWKAAGWHPQYDEDQIGLHMYGKRGKLLKSPAVSLCFDPVVNELYMDLDGNFSAPDKKRERPWVVRANGMNTVTFKNFDKAAALFVEYSRQVTPNPAPAPK